MEIFPSDVLQILCRLLPHLRGDTTTTTMTNRGSWYTHSVSNFVITTKTNVCFAKDTDIRNPIAKLDGGLGGLVG